MEITVSERRREEDRLRLVMAEIGTQLEAAKLRFSQKGRDVLALRREGWRDAPQQVRSFDDVVELAQQNQALGDEERVHRNTALAVRRLERMADSPYFGRIDVHIDGEEAPEAIYIGIATLRDEATGALLVYDWRAPVSSLFYDAEPGPAEYRGSAGAIACNLLLKRQYRIKGGVLQAFFDTDIKIDDEILQEVLARQSGERMRTIVYSIQREQNRVIRDEANDLLMVQGPAGSGKTSIALHRVAYLLYRHRKTLQADQVVILSPNRIFSDYIREVLPELGEENARQITFEAYAREQLGSGVTFEDRYDQVEALLAGDAAAECRRQVVAYKASTAFLDAVKAYAAELERALTPDLDAIEFDGIQVAARDELVRLYRETYAFLPPARRLQKVQQRIEYLLDPIIERKVQRLADELEASKKPEYDQMSAKQLKAVAGARVANELRPLRERVRQAVHTDLLALYKQWFADPAHFAESAGASPGVDFDTLRQCTLEPLAQGVVPYEDIPTLVYLKLALYGSDDGATVRHVVVDEAQDYSPLQYEVIKALAPRATLTVLGDVDQSLEPQVLPDHYGAVAAALGKSRASFIRLEKSYRSTQEIARFTHALLDRDAPVDTLERPGPEPFVGVYTTPQAHIEAVRKGLETASSLGYESIAVICKTAGECEAAEAALKDHARLHRVTKDETAFWHGTVVIPVYLAKGLEFEAVLVYNAAAGKYERPEDRRWLYVACTRALHSLAVYSLGEPSPFLARASGKGVVNADG